MNFQNIGTYFGLRYRGYLIAPVTGTYRLWIAGNDDCQLWLADGTVKYPATGVPLVNAAGKQLLAQNSNPPAAYQDFDRLPGQSTRSLHLVQGQAYYIEVLHKEGFDGKNHLSVAWQVPGQVREIIPATAFQGYTPDEYDADDDSLPDAWESAVGLNPADNGLLSSLQGQYGDFDADGLTNLEEFQYGTNPKSADTDGDGLTDYQEIRYYKTNPLVANIIQTTLAGTINLTSPSDSSVSWKTRADGSILAYERRGWTDWKFTVLPGQEGVHERNLG